MREEEEMREGGIKEGKAKGCDEEEIEIEEEEEFGYIRRDGGSIKEQWGLTE